MDLIVPTLANEIGHSRDGLRHVKHPRFWGTRCDKPTHVSSPLRTYINMTDGPETQQWSILALTAFLQSKLGVVVSAHVFCTEGLWWEPSWHYNETIDPSSLVSIEPYAPGGLRRLVLNWKSPLVHKMARALTEDGCTDSVLQIGRAMIRSCNWPIGDLDTKAGIRWKAAPGVISCPNVLSTWPVPHIEVPANCEDPTTVPRFLIYPLRICQIKRLPQREYIPAEQVSKKQNKTAMNQDQGEEDLPYLVTRIHELWGHRDEGLIMEFEALISRELAEKQTPGRFRWGFFVNDGHNKKKVNKSLLHYSWSTHLPAVTEEQHPALLTMAPSLPVFVVAEELLQRKSVSPLHSHAAAAQWLLRHDRMFGLSIFFGVPLMDRTGVLTQSVSIAPYCPAPPLAMEVDKFVSSYQVRGESDVIDVCRSSLRTLVLERAQELWAETETNSPKGSIMVAWSGGIDSTAVLCALLETSVNHSDRRSRLTVLLDDESISENPTFHKTHIDSTKLKEAPRNSEPLSSHAVRWRQKCQNNIMVTGEIGDQLFGSSKLFAAFAEKQPDLPDIWGVSKSDMVSPQDRARELFGEKGLQAPWPETILPALQLLKLLPVGEEGAWKRWIEPQLQQAPFKIDSTFDFLWWINFSCKWQNVSLRCIHDGGTPLLTHGGVAVSDIKGCIVHFFEHRNFECWSSVPEFHPLKFPDLNTWSTYKEPLKHYIKSFDGDNAYYEEKTKVGSLSFGAPEGPEAYVNHFYGATIQLAKDSKTTDTSTAKVKALVWGVCGMVPPSDAGLCQLLHPSFLPKLGQFPFEVQHEILGEKQYADVDPFESAPSLSGQEVGLEVRQRCRALLTPSLLEGRSLLDLKSDGGAYNFWALSKGAKQVTTVEKSREAATRTRGLLHQAKRVDTDNQTNSSVCHVTFNKSISSFLRACPKNSHDIILAVDLFQEPDVRSVLIDLTRVAKETILLDMKHPNVFESGILHDPTVPLGQVNDRFCVLPTSDLCSSTRPIPEQVVVLQQHLATEDEKKPIEFIPSRMAVETWMKQSGWDVQRLLVIPDRERKEESPYLRPRRFFSLPQRYLLKCTKLVDSLAYFDPKLATVTVANTPERFLKWDVVEEAHQVQYETLKEDVAPFKMRAWNGEWSSESLNSGLGTTTVYGFVYDGPTTLLIDNSVSSGHSSLTHSFVLHKDMYFSIPGRTVCSFKISGGTGILQMAQDDPSSARSVAMFQIGGPVEDGPGRLPYIDGCTDTLLLSPAVLGAPCLNHLHFPPSILQTEHTHPSGRSGMVIRGAGVCVFRNPKTGEELRTPLHPGLAFCIPTNVLHAFETASSGQGMDVIAFHPDSDFGPTGDDHPMVNRTMVNGISASSLPLLQTKLS